MKTESIARGITMPGTSRPVRWISPRYAMKTDALRGVLLLAALLLMELSRRFA